MKINIVYIMGAGRSGTTLLDVILGNAEDAFSMGEIRKFLSLNAIPHGFKEKSQNYKFWQKVKEDFLNNFDEDLSFSELNKISSKIENHKFFFLNLFFFSDTNKEFKIYKKYIKTLFESISRVSRKSIIIDSSKYQGRALALSRLFGDNLLIIYIKRNRKDVIKSFLKKNIEQPSKNIISANLYYFLMNITSKFVLKTVKGDKIEISYNKLIETPKKELMKLNPYLNIKNIINKIERDESFKVGYIFEGNRIRLKDKIKIEK